MIQRESKKNWILLSFLWTWFLGCFWRVIDFFRPREKKDSICSVPNGTTCHVYLVESKEPHLDREVSLKDLVFKSKDREIIQFNGVQELSVESNFDESKGTLVETLLDVSAGCLDTLSDFHLIILDFESVVEMAIPNLKIKSRSFGVTIDDLVIKCIYDFRGDKAIWWRPSK